MLLLDTNVVSGLRKKLVSEADSRLLRWAQDMAPLETFVSAISLLEIEQGILLIERRDKPQAEIMRCWFRGKILAPFKDRTLPVDAAVALRAAALHVPDPKPERDCLIAATALVHGMTVVTRNTKDFGRMNVQILNPWAP